MLETANYLTRRIRVFKCLYFPSNIARVWPNTSPACLYWGLMKAEGKKDHVYCEGSKLDAKNC